jgi:hypothetical protein
MPVVAGMRPVLDVVASNNIRLVFVAVNWFILKKMEFYYGCAIIFYA